MDVIYFNKQVEKDLYLLPKASRLIKLLETFGNRLGMPYSKPIDTNLFELRARGQQEIRILYCFYKGQAVLLHWFIKKTQKTPQKEISTALKRKLVLT